MKNDLLHYPVLRLTPSDANSYQIPKEIWQGVQPPTEIYAQGSDRGIELLRHLPESGLAIVGTRNPQPRSVIWMKNKIRELSGSRLTILSGLARGIDTAAHLAALEAHLPTIAVLGSGHHFPYPQGSEPLKKRILDSDGLILSEFPPHFPAYPSHFLQRNRLIASWSKAVWVMEAGFKSGALNTAYWAREHQRICFATPAFPGDPAFAGNQLLLDRDHAFPFWGIHSLGAAWLPLATHTPHTQKKRRQKSNSSTLILTDLELAFIQQTQFLSHQKGGAQIQELLDGWFQKGGSASDFFSTLQTLVQRGLLTEHQGTLIFTGISTGISAD